MHPPKISITILCIALSFALTYIFCTLVGNSVSVAFIAAECSALLTCLGMFAILIAPRPPSWLAFWRKKKASPSARPNPSTADCRADQPLPPGTTKAAEAGCDYYIATPCDLQETVQSNIIEPRTEQAMKLAKDIVACYTEQVSQGGQTSQSVTLKGIDCSDYNVAGLAEKILKARGWGLNRYTGSLNNVTLSPINNSVPELDQSLLAAITKSTDLADLIAEKIHSPVAASALAAAAELIEKYEQQVKAGKETSVQLTVKLASKIDFYVEYEMKKILDARGWYVSTENGGRYFVRPLTEGSSRFAGGRKFIV